MMKIILFAVAGSALLLLASGQIGRWRFRHKVVAHFERLYPDDRFRFEDRITKKSIWYGPLSSFANSFNPTGSKSHPLYWWKYEGTLISERLGVAFRVGGKPGRERSGGNWATAYFHDTWTEIPDIYPDWPVGQMYEDALEQRLADSVHTIWDDLTPELELYRDYSLTRDRRLYVGWWEVFRELRNEKHVLVHRGVETEHRYEPMPEGAIADLHGRLHAQRNFVAWFFCDPANADQLTPQKIARTLETFARRAAAEAGIDGTLRGTVIDREALIRDTDILYDLFRGRNYDKEYEDWTEEHRALYDAVQSGDPLMPEDHDALVKVIGRSTSQLDRLDRYVLGRYEVPLAADGAVRGVNLPAAWTARLDAALQEETRRAFGPNAYGRFEPRWMAVPFPVATDAPPRDGWQATVFVMADSTAILPTEQAVRRFSETLGRRTGVETTVDVYAISTETLRYNQPLKYRLITSDDLAETSRETYWLGVTEALFRKPRYPYKYLNLSEFDLERLNNPRRRQPDPLPEGSVEAFYRLMRPRANFDVLELLDGGQRPILRHYRTSGGRTTDLTDANPVTDELLQQYEERCPADAFTTKEKARQQRAQEELRQLTECRKEMKRNIRY